MVVERSRAMVLVADRQLEMHEFALPEISDDDGLLKVERCGICRSDADQCDGTLLGGSKSGTTPNPYPLTPGHEPIGGPDVATKPNAIWANVGRAAFLGDIRHAIVETHGVTALGVGPNFVAPVPQVDVQVDPSNVASAMRLVGRPVLVAQVA
jgi:hypothetical protein